MEGVPYTIELRSRFSVINIGFLSFKYKRKSLLRVFIFGAFNAKLLYFLGVECIMVAVECSKSELVRMGSVSKLGRLCIMVILVAFNARNDITNNKVAFCILQLQPTSNFFPCYKRSSQVKFYITFSHVYFISSCLSQFSPSVSSYFLAMEHSFLFKNALLESNIDKVPSVMPEVSVNPVAGHIPFVAQSCSEAMVGDLMAPPLVSKSMVLNELPQVQKDIMELTKSCLIGKMLSTLLDSRTIISRTKGDWKFVKGEVEYLEMGNGWIMLKFSNPGDLYSLIWSERPWHVQGDLFVIYPWRPSFDPYVEELKWVDLWVRIPRLPTELLNFESVSTLLAANGIGALIKLDPRSLLRHKIHFA